MSFMKSYLSVLNEETKKNSSVAADNTGELDGAEKAKKLSKDSGPEAIKNLEKPTKGPHSEFDSDALPKSVKSESKNPFDLLFNKIVAEEAFGDEEGDTLDFSGEIEDSEGDDLDFDAELSDEDGDSLDDMEDELSEEPEGLEAVLDHLKSAVAALETYLGSDSEESEDMDMDSDEDMETDEFSGDETDIYDEEDDETPLSKESVDAEIEGHAIVDQEKLKKKLDSKSNKVNGAVPVSKKKAQVVKGKKFSGKPEPFKCDPNTLTNKSKQNVGGVKVNKGLFDQ